MGQNVARYGGRRKLAVAALALGLGVAACSSGAGKNAVSLKDTSGQAGKPAAPGAGGPTSPTGATGGAPVSGGTGGTVTGSPTPATTTTPGSATTAPAHATATTATTLAKPTTPAAGGPAPTPTGTYTYNLVGTGSSTLTSGGKTTAFPPTNPVTLGITASGSRTEQWVNPATTLNLSFTNGGVYLLAEAVPVANVVCTFGAPVAYPPWPLRVTTVSGHATCGQGTTLSLKVQVTGTAGVTVNGVSVPTYVVQNTLTLSNTNLVVAETDWYAPTLRLPVKTTVDISGSASGSSITSAATYLLASS